ncbi:hypothetical protein NFX31_06080 [Microbacterium azadirachtae]|uniref:hypothetical protein n=1 Tax=Microbacterium azadirachtae TaxID=582680 RepID=UPI0021D4BC24|nr:hypothetical protein [Microbacterium azadirachtae]UXW87090.1 hypothetical protein NFX31_06080 [Microbacterium azadirachtae]
MDWAKIGAAVWDWVPWLIGLLGAVWGVSGEIRARRTDKRSTRDDNAPPWEDAQHVSGELFTVRNGSTRDVIVFSIRADSENKRALLEPRTDFPLTVHPTDVLDFFSRARYSLDRPNVVIVWRFADDDTQRWNRRILPSVTP